MQYIYIWWNSALFEYMDVNCHPTFLKQLRTHEIALSYI